MARTRRSSATWSTPIAPASRRSFRWVGKANRVGRQLPVKWYRIGSPSKTKRHSLGRSPTAELYGLSGVAEARAYAAHPLLGQRLCICCQTVLPHLRREQAAAILGPIDALKLGSSMALFSQAVPDEPLFSEVRAAIR